MKRLFALFSLSSLFLVGCQDATLIEDVPAPNFDWSDATSDPVHPIGQEYVAFLPPLRPSPESFAGDFNPIADPTVEIYRLPRNPDDPTLPPLAGCAPEGSVAIEPPALNLSPVIIPDGREEYETSWVTGVENGVELGYHRICIKVGGQEVAWRDVKAQDANEDNRSTSRSPTWAFNNGRTVPISFHISLGLSCSLGSNIDCTEFLFQPGVAQTALCDRFEGGALCGGASQVVDGISTFSEPTLVRIQLVQCPRDGNGRITHLDVETDVPLFPGCVDVEALNVENVNIPPEAPFILGACLDLTEAPELSARHTLAQLHHRRPSGVVEALPQVFFPLPLEGQDGACAGWNEFVAEESSGLMRFAKRGWQAIQEVVSPWFGPEPLVAGDRGVGGEMSGDGAFSPAVWGLPVQQERGQIVGGQFVGWTDPERVDEGAELLPAVKVTDVNGDPAAGATVRFDPVAMGNGTFDYTDFVGASVITDYFTSEQKVVTGSDGIVAVAWSPPLGPSAAEASAVGIGCLAFEQDGDGDNNDCRIEDGFPPPNPPSADGTGPFGDNAMDRTRVRIDLATGVTLYNAFGCPSSTAITVDGVLNEAPWASANSKTFDANISGGSVPATLSWYNDCDNLYFALEVQTANDKANIFGLDFDEDNDGSPALNDDVLVFDPSEPMPFMDLHLSQKCLNSNGQSACGVPDLTNDGAGAFSQPGMVTTVYEMSHPLIGSDPMQDFQLAFGDHVSFFVTLRIGKGAQGNTQWPDFRQYCTINIVPGGGSSPISCPAMP